MLSERRYGSGNLAANAVDALWGLHVEPGKRKLPGLLSTIGAG
jgi:hypothetical protein